jgi:Heparinase II/III-like protein/Heparinase II/III N-terminus
MRLDAGDRSTASADGTAPPDPATESAGDSRVPSARIGWYLRRLQRMSPRELLWRSSDVLRKKAWQPRQVPAATAAAQHLARATRDEHRTKPKLVRPLRFESPLPAGALEAVPADDLRRLVRAADEIMAGRWEVLGVTRLDMVAPDWFLDPLSGRRAPQAKYCFSVNHRNETVTGNVKQVWELSRHHHLTVLAAAYALTGDRRYAERAASHLRSWWEENPFLSGIHWTSGIELGIRLISWVWIRRLLDGWADVKGLFEENELAREQIWWHQTYLSGFRSRGSSANNHVVAEAAGQLVAALAFPWFEESSAWAQTSAGLLERELANNTFPSGVNRELAFDYHGLVAELGLLAAVEADRAGHPLPDETWRSLGRMLDVIAACLDCGLRAPRQGDSDEGRALLIASPEGNRWEVLLALGQTLFGAPEWWPPAKPGVASTILSASARRHALPSRPASRPKHFDDAGITILRSQPAGEPEIWCRCDSGPHGFLSIAAHAHADALSIEVRHDGTDILADPGTYCYSSDPLFRRYFRSTIGHNTLEVLGRDQSISGGPTMWIRHAKSRLTDLAVSADGDDERWAAEHYGYQTLNPPVTHRRTVEFRGKQRLVEVTDEIIGTSRPAVRLAFHLGPTVEADLDGCVLVLRWPDRDHGHATATMTLPSSLDWSLTRGASDPVLGWYSPAFGQKVPATDVIGVGFAAPGSPLRTRLAF